MASEWRERVDIPGLKRCPFCRSKAIAYQTVRGTHIECTNRECGAMQTPCDYEIEAAAAWNRRAAR